jgi:hypothetical protein
MPTKQKKIRRRRRRSAAVPLTIVPALAALVAATGCSRRVAYDPCEPVSYQQVACDSAVAHHGYWYGGSWYARTYPYLPLYYYSHYNSYLAGGGRVRSISPTVYSPSVAAPSRANVVRGGFGGIGMGHGAAGS